MGNAFNTLLIPELFADRKATLVDVQSAIIISPYVRQLAQLIQDARLVEPIIQFSKNRQRFVISLVCFYEMALMFREIAQVPYGDGDTALVAEPFLNSDTLPIQVFCLAIISDTFS